MTAGLGRRNLRASLESTHFLVFWNDETNSLEHRRGSKIYDNRGGQIERIDRLGTQGQGEASQFRCKSRRTRRREAERKRAASKQPWTRVASATAERGLKQ